MGWIRGVVVSHAGDYSAHEISAESKVLSAETRTRVQG